MAEKKIGFMGLMLSGKSHVGKLWADKVFSRTGIQPLRVDIAFPLKQELADRYGVPLAVIETEKDKYRRELQDLGMQKREADQNYLIDLAVKQAEPFQFAYIENVRMPNEVNRLVANGWLIIGIRQEDDAVRIQRLVEKYGRPPTEEESTHDTEKFIIPMMEEGWCHFVFENSLPEHAEDMSELLAQWAQGLI